MSQLIHYETACREIALANTIDEAKDWKDKAEALRAYARQANNTELECQVAEIKLRALRRMGELSKALETAERTRTDLRPNDGTQTKTRQLSDAGISKSSAHRAEQIAGVPDDEFEATLAEHRDEQKPVTPAAVMPRKTYKKTDQARNIGLFLKGVERIAEIIADPVYMASQMSEAERERAGRSMSRAALFIKQIEDALNG